MKRAEEVAPLWRERLIKAAHGDPRPLLRNALTALRQAPEWQGVLGFDEFAHCIVVRATPPWKHGDLEQGVWTSAHDIWAADWLQGEGIAVTVNVAAEAVEAVAHEHCFHPVREYLDGLTWDKTPRLD